MKFKDLYLYIMKNVRFQTKSMLERPTLLFLSIYCSSVSIDHVQSLHGTSGKEGHRQQVMKELIIQARMLIKEKKITTYTGKS